MYDLILGKYKNDKNRWRAWVVSATILFSCICIVLIVVDNTYGIFGENDTEYCSEKPSHSKRLNQQNTSMANLKTQSCSILKHDECVITCSSISINDVVMQKVDSCGNVSVHLILQAVNFSSRRVERGWLRGFSKNITNLEIQSPINYVGKGAFADSPFENLDTLVLDNTKINYIQKDVFEDSTLSKFMFRFPTLSAIDFEHGILEHLSQTLSALQINNCILQPQTLMNLSGTGTKLNHLLQLDMRFNSIKYLMSNTFIDIPSTVQAFLSHNQIEYMEENALAGLEKSVQLFINNNKLETLPNGLFNELSAQNANIKISNNPWRCNCSLLWLKEFYEEKKSRYFASEPFICVDSDGSSRDYTKVDFCPSSTTTEQESRATSTPAATSSPKTTNNPITTRTAGTSTVSPSTPAATTPTMTPSQKTTNKPITARTTDTVTIYPSDSPTNGFTNFNCSDCSNKLRFKIKNNRLYSHTVSVRNGTVTYDFYELEDTPFYEIKLRNSIGTDYMIWINIADVTDFGCEYNVAETVLLEKLSYDQIYLICLLKQNENTVSPFDCTSLVVPPRWGERAWVVNKDKVSTIALYVGVLVVFVVVTALLMYCTIKRHPMLVKATKEVKENVIFDQEKYTSPAQSMYSTSDGYLTPNMYKRLMTRRRRSRKLSTISERDFEGAFNVVYDVSENHLYEPPPLPPNHPSKWRKLSCEDDFCYFPLHLSRSSSFRSQKGCVSPVHQNFRSKSLPVNANNYCRFHLANPNYT